MEKKGLQQQQRDGMLIFDVENTGDDHTASVSL